MACGAAMDPCCADRTCSAGVCVGLQNARCQTECGAPTQNCCANNQCGSGARCEQGKCVACGGAGEACCPGGGPGPAADGCAGALRCEANKCTACGTAGEACCADGQACVQGTACGADLKCAACGGLNEKCCRLGNQLFCGGNRTCNASEICVAN